MSLEETLELLNEYQREAVEDESKACLVKANVGSGKTTVLVTKIRYLHEYKHVPYEKMVVLTFTNKAADEIRERLCGTDERTDAADGRKLPKLQGADAAALAGFGTFHSVALRLLRDCLPVERLGYRRDFTVIEPEEELDMAAALIAEHKLRIRYQNRLKKRLEQEKKSWQQGGEAGRCQDDLFRLFALLETEKIRQNKFTFSDLISVSIRLLKEEREERAVPRAGENGRAEGRSLTGQDGAAERAEPDWIIVDEVQDSDRQQLDFISALMGARTRLFAVGDPNQVIYSWRGSEESIFFLLSRRFGARELTLPVNYRSNDSILEAARCFQQGGERLLGTRGAGEKIHVKNHYDPFQEAEYLAERIKKLHKEGIEYRKIAVFYRLQSQSEQLERVFDRYEVPYAVSVKKTVSDFPALSWFIKVLRFSCNTSDSLMRDAVLRDREYGAPGLEQKMLQFARWAEAFRGCRRAEEEELFKHPAEERLLPEPEEIYAYFDLDFLLKPSSAAFLEDRAQILAFCGRILAYVRQEELDFLTGMRTFLNSAALYGVKILQKEADEQADAVRLMTLHASKGLEFQYVFIIGVNYGLIPLRSKSWEEEEEERRLFFVGITRARDCLELSWYTSPAQARVASGASRYLEMIPEHLLLREDRKRRETADLSELRRAVQEAKRQREECGTREQTRRVRHARYGIGTVKREDESKIAVEFENYGEKEFIKAFTKLEEVL